MEDGKDPVSERGIKIPLGRSSPEVFGRDEKEPPGDRRHGGSHQCFWSTISNIR